ECPHCATGCNECIIDSVSRHDADKLNRKLALDWLGADFALHVGLADKDKLALPDGRFAPGNGGDVLQRLISGGAKSITMVAVGDPADWDIAARAIHGRLARYA